VNAYVEAVAPMAEPLKVMHCVPGNLYGGVESFLRTLAACREATPGLASEFALNFEGRLGDELRAEEAVVHRLGAVRFSRPWTVWRARRRLAALLESRRIDVLVNHACWPQALCGPVGRRMGRPVVYWMHDMIRGELTHWVDRRAARIVPDLVVVNSHCTAETLPRLYPRARSEVLRYAVPAPAVDRSEARAAVRAALGAPDEAVVIVIACRMEAWKGHGLLIEALARLRAKPGWSAWIAGGAQRPHEQEYLAGLKAAVRAGGIEDRVTFLGARDDVPRVLAAADVHCQPNTGPEPFGIAFVEALHAALPVVSTRMGGAAEIVTDECGILVPPADPGALAEALSSLIDDPAARTRLGAAGPARPRALCAPEVVLPRLEELLADVCSRRAAPAHPVAPGPRR
jgi:glycosyltransferase involved in cell wall biosynthesis